MSVQIQEIFSEICETLICELPATDIISAKIKKIYEDEKTQKRKVIYIQDKAKEPEKLIEWKDISKNQKMEYMAAYMKNNNVSGSLKSYAFSHIDYDPKTKKIKSVKLRKLT